MDFLNSKTARLVLCVCVCVRGERGVYRNTHRIPSSKKNILPECIAHWLVQTNKPKDNHAMQIDSPIRLVSRKPQEIKWSPRGKNCDHSPTFWFVNVFLVCVLFRYPCTIKSPYCQWNEPCQMHIQDYALPPHWVDKTRNNKTLRTLFGTHNKSARKGTYWRSQCHVQWQIPLPQPGLTNIQRLKKISWI